MRKVNLTYIIDDDNIFVFILKKLLEKNENFNTVLDFKNGEEVVNIIEKLDADLPDVILLDINMPIFDGWQFLEKVELLPTKDKLNVFIMTSSIDISDLEKARKFSTVRDYISKPINHEKLNTILEYL